MLEITATSVVIGTDEGRLYVPARVYHERHVLLMTPREEDRADAD